LHKAKTIDLQWQLSDFYVNLANASLGKGEITKNTDNFDKNLT
jgi:hypothetical protein